MAESGACALHAAVCSARPMGASMTKAVPAASNEEAEDLKWQPSRCRGLERWPQTDSTPDSEHLVSRHVANRRSSAGGRFSRGRFGTVIAPRDNRAARAARSTTRQNTAKRRRSPRMSAHRIPVGHTDRDTAPKPMRSRSTRASARTTMKTRPTTIACHRLSAAARPTRGSQISMRPARVRALMRRTPIPAGSRLSPLQLQLDTTRDECRHLMHRRVGPLFSASISRRHIASRATRRWAPG
jgi:hypothetical protein